MDTVIAKREFWSHLKFDENQTSSINVSFVFNKPQYDKIKSGSIPDDIASGYLAYYENNILYIHSIMGGDCYFELTFYEDNDLAFCNKIKKYTKFMSTDTEQQTINFVKSFVQYSITQRPVIDRTNVKKIIKRRARR